MSLEVIDGKQTNWTGLWYHAEYGGFSSAAFDLSELKKFKGKVRLYVRKNKFYSRDTDRPNYNFCLKDAKSETFDNIWVVEDGFEPDAVAQRIFEDKDDSEIAEIIERALGVKLYTRDEAQIAVNGATRSALNGYTDNLVEDYI